LVRGDENRREKRRYSDAAAMKLDWISRARIREWMRGGRDVQI
jgi:hypothetical protein